jgi:hypothetical protein
MGARISHAHEQGHNHNIDSVTLNYTCPVSRLCIVSHNRTKCRDSGTREQNYFLSIMPMQVYNTPLRTRMGAGPPPCGGLPRGLSSTFFTLMVGTPGSPASTPPRDPPSMFLSVDGGCSWIFSSDTSQGAHRRRFLALMVGSPRSPAPAPPRGPVIDVS